MREPVARRIIGLVTATLVALPVLAADRRSDDHALAASMKASHVRIEGERAIVWAPAGWDRKQTQRTVAMLDAAVADVEKVLGTRFDAASYGQQRIEYFISDSDDVPSHVIGGYQHDPQSDPPYVFLSGLSSGEAPHLHETAHIIAGRFGSLLLREGLATYAQFTTQPGPMRPLAKLEGVVDLSTLDRVLPALLAQKGARERVEAWLATPSKNVRFDSRPDRALFYSVSASFVAHMVGELGVETFMRIYAQDDVAAALGKESGRPWSEWTAEWIKDRTP